MSLRRDRGHVHAGRYLHDSAYVQCQHHAQTRFPDTGTRGALQETTGRSIVGSLDAGSAGVGTDQLRRSVSLVRAEVTPVVISISPASSPAPMTPISSSNRVGASSGVQVNFTLLGIRLLVGRPIEDMKNRAFAPEEDLRRVCSRADPSPVRRHVVGRVLRVPRPRPRDAYRRPAGRARGCALRVAPVGCLARAVEHRLHRAGGRLEPEALHRTVQARNRRLAEGLRPHPAVWTPVVRAIRAGHIPMLADLAIMSGYYDQSHLNRDVREFAGTTPGELLESLLPDRGGFAV